MTPGSCAPPYPAGTFCADKKYPKSRWGSPRPPLRGIPRRLGGNFDGLGASEWQVLLLPPWRLKDFGCRPVKGEVPARGTRTDGGAGVFGGKRDARHRIRTKTEHNLTGLQPMGTQPAPKGRSFDPGARALRLPTAQGTGAGQAVLRIVA